MIYFKNPIYIEKKINNKIKILNKKNFFCLPMFPYPSGKLHLGHVRNYTLTDIIIRLKLLKKKKILHSISWDTYGLPAENASIKYNLNPFKWTISNVKLMRLQIKKIGIFINKNTEFLTCDFNFYKWEFYLFLLFIKNNLLFRNFEKIYWDKEQKCILSNEQINKNICWRSGIVPEKKKIFTWFINIKKYTKRFINNLKLNNWSKKIKNIQKKWINIKIFFFKKIKKLYLNININYININNIKNIKKKILYLIIKKNINKKIFKKKIFINNEKIFLTNFNIEKKKIIKKKINKLIFINNFYFLKTNDIKNWAFERYRKWGSGFFYKKIKKINFLQKNSIDTFFQSSWYYLKYLKSKNINNEKKNKWYPIKLYVGGEEHANLHLLYLRFINKILYDFKIIKNKEIVKNLINQGLILNNVYYKKINNKKVFCKKTKKTIFQGIEKMSKSKKNGINPLKIIFKFGSDILRLIMITQKPINKSIKWCEIKINIVKKFLLKINNFIQKKEINDKKIYKIRIFNIKKIHKIISTINKILLNNISLKQIENIVYNLSPIIPNVSKIFWFKIGNNFPIENYNDVKKNIIFYKLYYKNKFIKNIKKINFKKLKIFNYIKKIIISMDEISILLI